MLKKLVSKIARAFVACCNNLRLRCCVAWKVSTLESIRQGMFQQYQDTVGTELEKYSPFRHDVYEYLARAISKVEKLRDEGRYQLAYDIACRAYDRYVSGEVIESGSVAVEPSGSMAGDGRRDVIIFTSHLDTVGGSVGANDNASA